MMSWSVGWRDAGARGSLDSDPSPRWLATWFQIRIDLTQTRPFQPLAGGLSLCKPRRHSRSGSPLLPLKESFIHRPSAS